MHTRGAGLTWLVGRRLGQGAEIKFCFGAAPGVRAVPSLRARRPLQVFLSTLPQPVPRCATCAAFSLLLVLLLEIENLSHMTGNLLNVGSNHALLTPAARKGWPAGLQCQVGHQLAAVTRKH